MALDIAMFFLIEFCMNFIQCYGQVLLRIDCNVNSKSLLTIEWPNSINNKNESTSNPNKNIKNRYPAVELRSKDVFHSAFLEIEFLISD